jgi:hypothetical protein
VLGHRALLDRSAPVRLLRFLRLSFVNRPTVGQIFGRARRARSDGAAAVPSDARKAKAAPKLTKVNAMHRVCSDVPSGRDARMRTFSCFVTDDRYSVPTLTFLMVADAALARELALRRLLESPHHQKVEVLEDGEPVFTRDRMRSEDGAASFC